MAIDTRSAFAAHRMALVALGTIVLALTGWSPAALASSDPAAAAAAEADDDSRDGDRQDRGDDEDDNAIRVLSSAPHLVSGGSALLSVTMDDEVARRGYRVFVGTRDVTALFAPAGGPNVVGLVDGLTVGENVVEVRRKQGGEYPIASLKLRNWPIEGPIVSGPHQTPFFCQTDAFVLPDGSKLGPALDANCSVTTRVHYLYKTATGTTLKPMTVPGPLPADVGTTTTIEGKTVPFVVRIETGTVDRGIYQSAVLHDPSTESAPTPLAPPKAWNRRLVAIEGFGCPGGWYIQGASEGNLSIAGFDFTLLSLTRLGEGYAMFANTLHHASNNCNAVLASEAVMMSKEQFIKRHGVPAFTVSAGCSGGSYGSAQPADRIPRLFDGVMLLCTFPDPLAIAFTGSDGHLLTNFLYATNPGVFSDAQIAAITGHKGVKAFTDAANQSGRTDPVPNRVDFPGYVSAPFNAIVPIGLRYDPVANPHGIRGTVYDAAKNVYGIDPATGFALRPFDNVGVQYGLQALNTGAISVNQFILINQKVGGYDNDANYVPQRTVGSAGAMRRGQQGGMQLGGNGGLARIPIFDVSGIYNDDGGYHYQWFHFALRDRLAHANGNADNHVMWRGNPVPADPAWKAFIAWVQAYKSDTGHGSQRDKVIRNKPVQDGCWNGSTFIAEPQTLSHDATTMCNALFPSWTSPRLVAGGPVRANIMKCALKPVSASDYAVPVSAAQLAQLQAIFPSGVCDWSKRGNQRGVVPGGSFGPSPVNLVFDVTAP
jgi:hypothetical protein